MTRLRCDRAPAWGLLQAHYAAQGKNFDTRQAFTSDVQRFARFSQSAPHVFVDLSKNRIDTAAETLLLELADQCGLSAHREAMFSGEKINATEGREVWHVLLRTPADAPTGSTHEAAELAKVHEILGAMLAYAEKVRADEAITDVVNIGIGGSDLGPQMAVLALHAFAHPSKRMHFVSNIDGHELAATLARLKPENTLFLIASKTFTTIETMTNAASAKRWFEASGGKNIARHFAALTTNVVAAKDFGIDTTFGFWDWVGGRYSLWSAIGLLGVWYRNFHGFSSRSVAPYHSALRRLPAYLQQLEMESNGKRVDASGEAVPFGTSPIPWGESGTNGQHAYFQMLHQGTDVVPVEFVAVKKVRHTLEGHHDLLLANVLAQAQALMQGKSDAGGHKHFPGNRPSTVLLLEDLTPASLGALIALQEHRVFVSGALWGINSFDQWGVELGKVLAKDIAPRLHSGDANGLDGSTAGLLAMLRS